jgi:hypothetical protein
MSLIDPAKRDSLKSLQYFAFIEFAQDKALIHEENHLFMVTVDQHELINR